MPILIACVGGVRLAHIFGGVAGKGVVWISSLDLVVLAKPGKGHGEDSAETPGGEGHRLYEACECRNELLEADEGNVAAGGAVPEGRNQLKNNGKRKLQLGIPIHTHTHYALVRNLKGGRTQE